jgi:hypothetical protein
MVRIRLPPPASQPRTVGGSVEAFGRLDQPNNYTQITGRPDDNCGARSPRNDAIGNVGTLALLTARPPPEQLIRFRVKAYAISR